MQHAGRAHLRDVSPERREQVGSDADLVVYDPAYRGKFSLDESHSNVDYNAYEN